MLYFTGSTFYGLGLYFFHAYDSQIQSSCCCPIHWSVCFYLLFSLPLFLSGSSNLSALPSISDILTGFILLHLFSYLSRCVLHFQSHSYWTLLKILHCLPYFLQFESLSMYLSIFICPLWFYYTHSHSLSELME